MHAPLIYEMLFEFTFSPPDNRLFKAAIHPSSATGMTPLHHLVFNSKAELSPNSISTNALYILNLPANYSPRMLLQLFKERYASAYRALIPAPSEKWKIRTAREKLYGKLYDYYYCRNHSGTLGYQRPNSLYSSFKYYYIIFII